MRPKRISVVLALGSMLAACGARSPSRPADATALRRQAADDFDQGVAAFGRGEYAVALAYFDRAAAGEPSSAVEFDIARTHEAMGHDAQAARYYVRYLQAVDPAHASYAIDATQALERLRPRLGWILVRTASTVFVDGVRVDPSPVAVPVAVLPGVRVVSRPAERDLAVRIRAGDVLSLDFAAPDAPLVFAYATDAELRDATNPRIP